jgi:hypothetical protein
MNRFYIGAIFLLCLVLELRKISSSGYELSKVFGIVTFVSIISFSKKLTLNSAQFFYRA